MGRRKAERRVIEAARELELRARSNRDNATMNGLRTALAGLGPSRVPRFGGKR